MTDVARHHTKTTRKRRGASAGLLFALATLIVLIVGAAALVALMLWPRWPGTPAAPDAPALPVTVGGVLFNVPPAAIRIPVQRHSGATERLDLAFLWPSLASPDPNAKLAPTETTPPIDRLFITIEPQSVGLPPNERVRTIYPRYLADTQFDGPDGLKVIPFKEGTPYQNEDLFFDPAAQPGFVARCSRPGAAGTPGICLYERRIESADVTVRFPSEWLTGWRTLNEGIAKLIGQLKPGS
ncbi:MAG: hypothetical protein WCE79_11785 [Xanthobacteraceae bacterium]